jgi:nuclear transport factor 2 (NTF2) superfamily protein
VLGVRREKVKALVFQAREALIADRDARGIPCEQIRGVLETTSANAPQRAPIRRHLQQCAGCRDHVARPSGEGVPPGREGAPVSVHHAGEGARLCVRRAAMLTRRACARRRSGRAAMRPPVPPFSEETARQKVQAAEDAWNTRDPERVAAAYTLESQWRNRDEFLTGRPAIVEFLRRKWERELDYALRKDLWAFTGNRIAVRFQYESRDAAGQWWRSYGNEQWEFDDEGYMRRREASIDDVPIEEPDRRIFGPRPESERGAPLPLR